MTNKSSIHFSSGNDHWTTPEKLFNELNALWGFTVDVACEHSTALCSKHYTPEENGLEQDWSNDVFFCNPPYSNLKPWLAKSTYSYQDGETGLVLVPARTDTIAFQDYATPGSTCICFIKGRLKFGDPNKTSLPGTKNNSSPFPSVIIVFDNNLTDEKLNYLKSIGTVMKNV